MKTDRNSIATRQDLKAHAENRLKHGKARLSDLNLTQYYVYRGNASNQPEATNKLEIHDDGAEATIDHSDGTLPRMVNVVYVASPGALVAANTVPVGTLGIIYTP